METDRTKPLDDPLRDAIQLFNEGRFSEFQDAVEAFTSTTRAPSERAFYTVLKNLAESLIQLGDGDLGETEQIVTAALRKLDEFLPRYREINVVALRDEFRTLLLEVREARDGRRSEHVPPRLPRLRVLPH
jgi:hypothetical protein